MPNVLIYTFCKLFGHKWSWVTITLDCEWSCYDKVWTCDRCRIKARTPGFRGWFCKKHNPY